MGTVGVIVSSSEIKPPDVTYLTPLNLNLMSFDTVRLMFSALSGNQRKWHGRLTNDRIVCMPSTPLPTPLHSLPSPYPIALR